MSATADDLGIQGGLGAVEDVQVTIRSAMAAAVVQAAWDASTSKFVLFTATGELANATSVTGLVLEVTTYSKS